MKKMNLSIVIPLYNESKRLQKTLSELQRLTLPAALNLEKVIFVNDGSTDRTKFKISNLKFQISKKVDIQIVSYSKNMGKGHALRMGLGASTSPYTLVVDADMSTPLSEINKFLTGMKNDTDFLIGTRKNGHSTVIVHQSLLRESLGKGFTLITKIFLGIKGTDFTCGFKAFSENAKEAILKNASINRWTYDAEWLLIAKRNNLTTKEVAVIWSNDKDTKVRLGKDVLSSIIELLLIKKRDTLRQYSKTIRIIPTFAKNSA